MKTLKNWKIYESLQVEGIYTQSELKVEKECDEYDR